jgi:DUF4097 and DUF4098 domain-containing protein YvlB
MDRRLSAGIGLLAALALSGCGIDGSWGDRVRASVSETRPMSKGGTFSLDNTNGRIEVSGWDEDEVSIEATKRAGSERALREMEIDIDADDGDVRVRTRHKRSRLFGGQGRVDYLVKVPRTARVEIENVNGRVEVRGVSAAVDASTVNGSVEVQEATGAVEATAVNGSVEASLTRLDPEGESKLRTTNGSVRLTLPRDANADIEASTVNGGVGCDFELENGRKTRRRIEGRIGTGGARFDLAAVNGSVNIDRGLSGRLDSRPTAEEAPKGDK